jgi:hypothetical protein
MEEGKQHHHHHHYRQPPPPPEDNTWWCWGLIGLIFVVFLFFIVLGYGLGWWNYPSYYYTQPVWVPHSSSELEEEPPLPVVDASKGGAGGEKGAFNVLELRNSPRLHPHRKRTYCVTGELFNTTLGMCVPELHVPASFDLNLMAQQPAVSPCESLERNMCGRWLSSHEDEHRTFSSIYHKNKAYYLREAVLNNKKGARAFYDSCMMLIDNPIGSMRESKIEYQHQKDVILGDFRYLTDIPVVLGRLLRAGFSGPFVFSRRHDDKLAITPDGLTTSLTERQIEQLLISTRATITNYNVIHLQEHVQAILKIAAALRTNARSVVSLSTNFVERPLLQVWKLRGFQDVTNGWSQIFQEMKITSQETVIMMPETGMQEYLSWLLSERGIASFTVPEWRAFFEFSILFNSFQFKPRLPPDDFTAFAEKHPSSTTKRNLEPLLLPEDQRVTRPVKEARCIRLTQHLLPGLIAPTSFQQEDAITKLVNNVRAALLETILETTWLNDRDRAQLTGKIQAIRLEQAVPPAEPFAERLAADRYDHNMNLIRAHRVLQEPRHYTIPFATVSPHYSYRSNTLYVPPWILQFPLYDDRMSLVSAYASLGTLVAYELTQAIDGAHGLYWNATGHYIPEGILSNMTQFYDKADCIIRLYGPTPLGCEKEGIDYSNATLAKDLASHMAMRIAFDAAFHHALPAGDVTMVNKQHFFMIAGQTYCQKYSQRLLCESAATTDLNAFPEIRVDQSAASCPAFSSTFHCPPASAERCIVYGR